MVYLKKFKTLWPLFMDGVHLLEPLWGGSLLFTTKFSEIPGTHFIDLGRMKGWVNLGATHWFWTQDPGLEIQHLNHWTIAWLLHLGLVNLHKPLRRSNSKKIKLHISNEYLKRYWIKMFLFSSFYLNTVIVLS